MVLQATAPLPHDIAPETVTLQHSCHEWGDTSLSFLQPAAFEQRKSRPPANGDARQRLPRRVLCTSHAVRPSLLPSPLTPHALRPPPLTSHIPRPSPTPFVLPSPTLPMSHAPHPRPSPLAAPPALLSWGCAGGGAGRVVTRLHQEGIDFGGFASSHAREGRIPGRPVARPHASCPSLSLRRRHYTYAHTCKRSLMWVKLRPSVCHWTNAVWHSFNALIERFRSYRLFLWPSEMEVYLCIIFKLLRYRMGGFPSF